MTRVRLLAKLRAYTGGYFWLPCPKCGEYFGGHEWDHHYVGIATDRPGVTKGVCNACAVEIESRHPPGSRIIVDLDTGIETVELEEWDKP